MAKLMVWDRCLSKEEILSSFNNTIDGLVLDYDFSHDKLLKDQTGNNNNGLVFNCEKLEEKLKNLLQAASYQIINNQSNKQINQYDLFSENSNTTTTINNNQNGGSNPGFKAFLDLKKYVATKLKIPNGPKAASIASAVQKDVKMKYPDLKDSLKIVEKAKEHFNKSPNKYYHN
mgnify:CR=1 FL=1